jgi:hypothetical protein
VNGDRGLPCWPRRDVLFVCDTRRMKKQLTTCCVLRQAGFGGRV